MQVIIFMGRIDSCQLLLSIIVAEIIKVGIDFQYKYRIRASKTNFRHSWQCTEV